MSLDVIQYAAAIESPLAVLAHRRAVVHTIEHAVEDNLGLLVPLHKAWQPTDFLPDLEAEDLAGAGRGLPAKVSNDSRRTTGHPRR